MPEPVVALKNLIARAAAAPEEGEKGEQNEEDEKKEGEVVDIASFARRALEKRRAEARRRMRKLAPSEGPSDGEQMSQLTTADVRMIALEKTKEDPGFINVRLHSDPLHPEWVANEGQHLEDLIQSIDEEGMKIPIVVEMVGMPPHEEYLVRAGSRRRKAAMKLGWSEIPAIVLPDFTPLEWQYWINILENTARKTLTTYELAVSAKRMRDEFEVRPSTFAKKTGFSSGYVSNLLGCIDRLPPYLLEQWRDGARIAFDQWVTLSHLEPQQAIRTFRKWIGFSPRDRMREADKNGRRRPLPPPRWLNRMQRLYQGIEGSMLEPRVRDLVLKSIEYCMGTTENIPGVYEPGKQRRYERIARMRSELKMPEVPDPGESRGMPPPVEETS